MKTLKKKYVYVSIGKSIIFKHFIKYKSPTGWLRLDILQKRIKEDKHFRNLFTKTELSKILKKRSCDKNV